MITMHILYLPCRGSREKDFLLKLNTCSALTHDPGVMIFKTILVEGLMNILITHSV